MCVGTWLKAWSEFDSSIRVFGIDGNNMEDSMFFIPKSNYQQVNLTNDYQKILESLNNNETYKASSMRGGGWEDLSPLM